MTTPARCAANVRWEEAALALLATEPGTPEATAARETYWAALHAEAACQSCACHAAHTDDALDFSAETMARRSSRAQASRRTS